MQSTWMKKQTELIIIQNKTSAVEEEVSEVLFHPFERKRDALTTEAASVVTGFRSSRAFDCSGML